MRQLLIQVFTLLFIFPAIMPYAQAQGYTRNYTSKAFTTRDGLADMTIWSLFQDKQGYLWVGTRGGVSRFDGLNFHNYYMADGLLDNNGHDIVHLKGDTYSVLTRFGISFITGNKVQSTPLPKGFYSQYFSYQAVSGNKLYLFNILPPYRKSDNATIQHFSYDPAAQSFTPQQSIAGLDVIKVFPKVNGLLLFDRGGFIYTMQEGHWKKEEKIADSLLDICRVSDSLYCFYDAARSGFYYLHINGGKRTVTPYLSFYINSYPYKRNIVATPAGDIYFNNNNDTIFRLRKGAIEPIVVAGEGFYDLMTDDQSSLWLGSAHGLKTFFNFYFTEYHFGKTNKDQVLNVVEDAKARLWFSGHNNGIWYLENDKVNNIPPAAISNTTVQTRALYNEQAMGAIRRNDGHLLFPYRGGIVEVAGKQLTDHYQHYAYISGLAENDANGDVYIAGIQGLQKFSKAGIFSDLYFKNNYNNASHYNLYKDRKGVVWAMTTNGIGTIRNDTIHPVKELDSLRITCMEQDEKGIYWIGTTRGLYAWTPGKKPWQTGKNIFKGEMRTLLSYDANTLIAADNKQVAMLNTSIPAGQPEAWIVFNNYSGYSGEDMIGKRPLKDARGNVWLMCEDRVVVCNPAEILQQRKIPQAYISAVNVTADNINWQPLDSTQQQAALNAAERNLDIQFRAVCLTDPKNIFYQYRLIGLSDQWSAPTTESNVIYSNLPANKYVFEVRASNDGARWSPAATIGFVIPNYWWQSWWAISLALVITGLMLWLLSKYYINLRWKQQMRWLEKQLAIEQERHRISGEIHDDLGAGLSGIRLQAELAARKATTPEMKAELSRIYDVASELSAKIREVIWSLNTENDNLEKLLYYMQQEAFKIFEHTNIDLRCSYPAQLPLIPVSGNKRRDIHLIVKEALHNALKHAAATGIWLQAEILNGELQIIVRDNGKGLPTVLNGEGNGMRNMQRRATKINGRLEVVTEKGTVLLLIVNISSLAK